MKSILDPKFQYVPAAHTDIRKTFARIRREQAAQAKRDATPPANVQPLKPRSQTA